MQDQNFNNIFDLDKIDQTEFNEKEFWKKFEQSLKRILIRRFGEGHPKTKIMKNYKGFNCSCPYCGDGRHVKHRFHIYYETWSFKCFNDSSYTSFGSIYRFLHDYHEESNYTAIELGYIKRRFDENMKNWSGISSSNANILKGGTTIITQDGEDYNRIQKAPEIDEYAFPREEIINARKLREVNKSSACINYLLQRKIIRNPMDVYKLSYPHFLYNEYYEDLYILNLASNMKDIIGIQIRHLSPRAKRRFTSINYGDIWKDIFKEEPSELPELRKKFDKLSMMWNALFIDYNRRFYILEGAIDAYCLNVYGKGNAIACLGLSNFVYNKSAYYIADNSLKDEAGKKKAIELLNGEYNTFLWGKFAQDYPEIAHDCKDINDIVKKNQYFDFSVLDNYFSNDPLSAIWL